MPNDIGVQERTVAYFDPVDSSIVNRIGKDVRKTGIYSGGYLTKVSDVSVSLSALSCEITDGTHQERIRTTTAATVTVSSTLTYVVLRWTYTGSAAVDYMEILGIAAGSLQANDLIVGVCSYSGSTLQGFVYTLRSNPQIMDLFLKVEPTVAASMYCRVRAGRVNYGTANYDIVDQLTPLMAAPVAGTNVYAIQVNAAGAVIATLNATTPPSYGGLVTLAEITLTVGQTTITASSIKDVRSFVTSGVTLTGLLPAQSGKSGYALVSNGTTASWDDVTYGA